MAVCDAGDNTPVMKIYDAAIVSCIIVFQKQILKSAHQLTICFLRIESRDMESINGWIKAELFMDFHVTGDRAVEEEINEYVIFFNEQRSAYSLN